MSKRAFLQMASLLMLSEGLFSNGMNRDYKDWGKEVPLEKPKRTSKEELLLSKGLKVFYIDGVGIVALNEKNAIRKFNKMKGK